MVLVKGASWQRLADAIQRPYVEYTLVHDPLLSANKQWMAGTWINLLMLNATCNCSHNIQSTTQYGRGDTGYSMYNAEGGDYYGERAASPQGRNRLDGNGNCYWDATDDGPDQCQQQPQPTGRFKYDGNGNCYWEPNDSGPNQCQPTGGRFKYDGSGNCYWDPNDSGPDQCSPLLVEQEQDERRSGLLRATWRAVTRMARSINASGVGARSASHPAFMTPSRKTGQFTTRSTSSGLTAATQSVASDAHPKIPYPETSDATEILANIAAAARQTTLTEGLGLHALKMEKNELRARRILDVHSLAEHFGPDYYLVELDDLSGAPYARVAISKAGLVISVLDERGKSIRRSLELGMAQREVAARGLGTAKAKARYVYGMSMAEAGSPNDIPLVEIETTKGKAYLNSMNKAFAEPGSTLERERGAKTSAVPFKENTAILQLRPLDIWE